MQYPPQLREQICSSIFRNANQKDMHIKKETMNILIIIIIIIIIIIKELVLSMDVLSKKLETICMLNLGDFFFLFCILIVKEKKKMSDNTYASTIFFSLKNLILKNV